MKAYFLSVGSAAESSLPTMLSALTCGATKEVPALYLLRVLSSSPAPFTDALISDLNLCHQLVGTQKESPFFCTALEAEMFRPVFSAQADLRSEGISSLLLQALRGKNMPLSFASDREAVEWACSSMLEQETEEAAPVLALRNRIRRDLETEEVRLTLLCDLCDGFSVGAVSALVRFFRQAFPDNPPFICLLFWTRTGGTDVSPRLGDAKAALSAFSDRGLIRAADHRETTGADAAWLLSLPSSLTSSGEAWRLVSVATARVLAEISVSSKRPSAGIHTRELPGILTLHALDQEAHSTAAFLRAACWCLSDLFPALHQYLEHPTLLRSLAPATRNGLFRRLFRSGDSGVSEFLPALERTMKLILLEVLSLIQGVPAVLRDKDACEALWQEAVRACGKAVTVAAEYDVSRQEAEESGVDQVSPVHRESMADTEEEILLKKLNQMAADLSEAVSARAEVFRKLGGFRSRQALEDCLTRCQVAEVSAREKLSALPADSPEERYSFGLQERRVRMLQAAVARCRKDLSEVTALPSLSAPAAVHSVSPFSGEILDAYVAEQCFSFLTSEEEQTEAFRKNVRDHLTDLLAGHPLNDAKTLLKNLISVCRQPDDGAPLRSLMTGIFSVCGVEVSGIRFTGEGELPPVSLLPDLSGTDSFLTLSAAASRMVAPEGRDHVAEHRGLLAMLLLREYRRRNAGEARLVLDPCLPEDGILSEVYLSSRNVDRAWIASLSLEEAGTLRKLPFAVLLPGAGLEPAFLSSAHADLVPSFAVWFQKETRSFEDPCPYLNAGDRSLLTELFTRLRAALNNVSGSVFPDFLADFHRDVIQSAHEDQADPLLPQRLKAACALSRLPAWQKDLSRILSVYEPGVKHDPVCGALVPGGEDFPAAHTQAPDEVLYAFRGVPFARESAKRLLDSPSLPGEARLLSSLNAECEILFHSSDDYHEALITGLTGLLEKYPEADPASRGIAETLLAQAREPVDETVTELTWPWDTVSASVQTILEECLGRQLSQAAMQPFSDLLTLFPTRGGEIIGDTLLSRMCMLDRQPPASGSARETAEETVAVKPDAVLPPLSQNFAQALCCLPEGRTLLQPHLLLFQARENGVTVVLTLEGAFTLRLIRHYGEEEILRLYTHDMPTAALWPSLPLPPDSWKAYFVYAHMTESFRAVALTADGREYPFEGAAPRFAASLPAFPSAVGFFREDQCIGFLPNLLPQPEVMPSGHWMASVDFGSSASSVIFSAGGNRFPLQGPGMVRSLIRNPASFADLLRQEFLPPVPVSAIVPGALRIFRNQPVAGASGSDSASDLNSSRPFLDGSILLSSSLADVLDVPADALYTDLKWNGEKGRAAALYLHQLMLLAALQARQSGALSLCWRAAVPDEMGPEGRERLVRLFDSLARQTAAESGLPFPEKGAPVTFASESAALGAYFRLCSPEETRGGFLLLDLGADTADLSLFLRGRESAVRTCQLTMGVHYILLPSLLSRPACLMDDFSFVADPGFLHDLQALAALLETARRDAAALRQARYALDAFLADHFPLLISVLVQRMMEGAPARIGALLILHLAYLMMLSGLLLLQISVDSGRNDALPERMSLCLAGRGSGLMEALPDAVKASLWRFLTMFRNQRVASLSLLFSSEKKLEIPVGLCCLKETRTAVPSASAVPVSIPIRPEELLCEFLLRFRREFPAEAGLLFPSMYANDPYAPFSPRGQELISEALAAAFTERESPRPYTSLSAFLSMLLDLSREEPGPAVYPASPSQEGAEMPSNV